MNIRFFWIIDSKTNLSFNFKYNIEIFMYNYLNNKIINIKFNKYYINLNNNVLKLNVFHNFTLIENTLRFIGLGYYIKEIQKFILEVNIGYSHKIYIKIPKNIFYKITNEGSTISFFSYNFFLIRNLTSKLKLLKYPEPYKGKGIHYIYEKFKYKIIKNIK